MDKPFGNNQVIGGSYWKCIHSEKRTIIPLEGPHIALCFEALLKKINGKFGT